MKFFVPFAMAGTNSIHQYKLYVTKTAYCLRGHTKTGTVAGPGTVAVDPSVIKLGSRMWIPGYGVGYARDTGAAVTGRHIDVWMSSCHDAMSATRYRLPITVY